MRETVVCHRVPPKPVSQSSLYAQLPSILSLEGKKASDDYLFKAVFGRDTLRVDRDLMKTQPALVRQFGLIVLAHHQGCKTDPLSMEEPGKIMHEYRKRFFGYEEVAEDQYAIMQKLGGKWGWRVENEEFCSYDSIDATPLYIIAVCEYVSLYGREFLDQRFQHYSGEVRTIRQSVLGALGWLSAKLQDSPLGLLEFQRTNPQGHLWPVMRDGRLSYIHPDGTLANFNASIASLDVQGLAYDALIMASSIFASELEIRRVWPWRELARNLQTNTLRYFWMEDEQYFAMALDRDPATGAVRQVKTLSSIAGELLDTGILSTLQPDQQAKYVNGIVRMLFSPEFLTDVGIRSLGRRHFHMFGKLIAYQGAGTVWGAITNAIARGLHRQGLVTLAVDLENRMINGSGTAGSVTEFYYVLEDGTVVYDPRGQFVTSDSPEIIVGTNLPEHTQAWTVSALLRALEAKRPRSYRLQPLEQEVLGPIRPAVRLTQDKLKARFPRDRAFRVDQESAKAMEKHILIEQGAIAA